ncbi:hypothetical protein JOB18_040716 [Solea senegalensis]|uniref:Selenoprotein F/M domain-containing protein n=1 Tax=Solea senegalensis TaxID=28829 RepID=A0AAV6QGS2_SOLSE|nr:hypothetical protein JOB18_040716 [Solea senegalensis]
MDRIQTVKERQKKINEHKPDQITNDVAGDPDVSYPLISPPPPPGLSSLRASAGFGEGAGGVMWWMTAEQAQRGQSLCDPGYSSLVSFHSATSLHNLVMKHIPGADPELVLLNHYFEELDRIPLSDMTRSEINALLGKLGFYKKAQPEDEVPEEFRFSPAKDSPFKDEHAHKAATSPPPPATESVSSEPDVEVKRTDL